MGQSDHGCRVLVHFVSTCAGRQFLVLVEIKTSNSSMLMCKIKPPYIIPHFGPTTQKLVRFSSSPLRTMNQRNLYIFHVYFGLVKICVPRSHLDSKLSLARVHLEVYSYYVIRKKCWCDHPFFSLLSSEGSIWLPQQGIPLGRIFPWFFLYYN